MSIKIDFDVIEKFIEKPHIFGQYLGYEDLIDIHSTWIYSGWISTKDKSLQAHRNSFKTTSILIVGILWYLLFWDRNATILVIRKSDLDAQKIVETIRQQLESKEIQIISEFLYKTPILKTENWSRRSLTIAIKETKTPEGSIDSKGTTSSVTGSHYDFIFPDDIITLKDRVSKAERDWIKDFIRELRNIKKEGGKIFFSGTPWHRDDGWTIIPEPIKYPIGSIDIKGFYKEEIESKIIEIKEGTTRSLYCANYDLKHVDDEDKIFTEPIYKKWPDNFKILVGWLDPAYSGKNTNALTLLGQSNDVDTKDQWFFRGWVWAKNVVDIYDDIIAKMKLFKAGTLYVESNADKGLSIKDLKQIYPLVRGKWEKQNKHMKIISYAKQHWKKLICAFDCDMDYLNQILDYQEKEEPDDAPDSLAALMREMGFSGYRKQSAPKYSSNKIMGW
jgi:hypothetical protein